MTGHEIAQESFLRATNKMQVNAISVNYKLIDRRSEDLGTPFEDASIKDTVLSPESMGGSIPPINFRMKMQHANLPER